MHKLPSPSAVPAIELHDLTLGYDRHPAVHHLSLRIAPGSLLALVGPNGAGKSTLIKALAGELRPISGTLHGLAGPRIAWLPQHSELDRSFPVTVRDMVALGLWHRVGAFGRFTAEHRRLCDEALAAVGLMGFEQRSLDTLSGGQLQRALFARLILQDAPVVLLDEPFAAVDNRTTTDLLALLHRWHRAGQDGDRGAARSGAGARALPAHPAAGARAGGLRPHRRGADRRALGTRPAHAGAVRRRRAALRGDAGHAHAPHTHAAEALA